MSVESAAVGTVTFWKLGGKWEATLRVDGKRVHLGYFESEKSGWEKVKEVHRRCEREQVLSAPWGHARIHDRTGRPRTSLTRRGPPPLDNRVVAFRPMTAEPVVGGANKKQIMPSMSAERRELLRVTFSTNTRKALAPKPDLIQKILDDNIADRSAEYYGLYTSPF